MLDKNTFGETPAAFNLVQELNGFGDKGLTRSVARAINSTRKSVKELISAYENGSVSSKTVANCLRLMRLEISTSGNIWYGNTIEHLRKNVQIGYIKSGLRQCSVARKGEKKMAQSNLTSAENIEILANCVSLRVGKITEGGQKINYRVSSDSFGDITPELLHERSNRRNFRRNFIRNFRRK